MSEGIDVSDGDGGLVDFTNVDAATYELLIPSKYPAVITEIEFKYSASSGQPMWAMVLEVNGGDYDGRKLFFNMSFSAKALSFTKVTLENIAPELLEGPFEPDDPEVYSQFENMDVLAHVVYGKYNGEKTNNTKQLYLASEGDID